MKTQLLLVAAVLLLSFVGFHNNFIILAGDASNDSSTTITNHDTPTLAEDDNVDGMEDVLRMDIWGAMDAANISPDSCGDGTVWWSETAKRTVIERYAKGAATVLFYDDTAANVAAASQLANVTAQQVSKQHIGFLVDRPSVTMWEDLKQQQQQHTETHLPPPRITVIFDFDLTLSDLHSGGTTLQVHHNVQEEHLAITVRTPGGGRAPFCSSKERCTELRANLRAVVQNPDTKLVILSRGEVAPIVEAFEFWGLPVGLAGGVTCSTTNGELVLSAPLSDAAHCCPSCKRKYKVPPSATTTAACQTYPATATVSADICGEMGQKSCGLLVAAQDCCMAVTDEGGLTAEGSTPTTKTNTTAPPTLPGNAENAGPRASPVSSKANRPPRGLSATTIISNTLAATAATMLLFAC